MPNGVSAPGQVSPPLVPMIGLTYLATSLGVQARSGGVLRSCAPPMSGEPPPPPPPLMSTVADASGCPLSLVPFEQAPAPSNPTTRARRSAVRNIANEEGMRHHYHLVIAASSCGTALGYWRAASAIHVNVALSHVISWA